MGGRLKAKGGPVPCVLSARRMGGTRPTTMLVATVLPDTIGLADGASRDSWPVSACGELIGLVR